MDCYEGSCSKDLDVLVAKATEVRLKREEFLQRLTVIEERLSIFFDTLYPEPDSNGAYDTGLYSLDMYTLREASESLIELRKLIS